MDESNKFQVIKNFIVFEGIDGSGKSTQINNISNILIDKNISIYNTKEPFDGLIGTFIRSLLTAHQLEAYDNNVASSILAYLFAADRYEHLYAKNGIFDNLAKNKIVLCDRYLFSSITYQGDKEVEFLSKKLNDTFPLPSLLIYFDLKPEIALERISQKIKDSMEKLEILEAVYKRYNWLIEHSSLLYPNTKTIKIDASLDQNTITKTITNYISNHLGLII